MSENFNHDENLEIEIVDYAQPPIPNPQSPIPNPLIIFWFIQKIIILLIKKCILK